MVIYLLQAFPNVMFRTAVQHLTIFNWRNTSIAIAELLIFIMFRGVRHVAEPQSKSHVSDCLVVFVFNNSILQKVLRRRDRCRHVHYQRAYYLLCCSRRILVFSNLLIRVFWNCASFVASDGDISNCQYSVLIGCRGSVNELFVDDHNVNHHDDYRHHCRADDHRCRDDNRADGHHWSADDRRCRNDVGALSAPHLLQRSDMYCQSSRQLRALCLSRRIHRRHLRHRYCIYLPIRSIAYRVLFRVLCVTLVLLCYFRPLS